MSVPGVEKSIQKPERPIRKSIQNLHEREYFPSKSDIVQKRSDRGHTFGVDQQSHAPQTPPRTDWPPIRSYPRNRLVVE